VTTHPARVTLFSSALPGWDAARTLAAVAALDLDTVEWGAGPGQAVERPRDGARIRALCDRAGVRVCGLSVQDPDATLDRPGRTAGYVGLARTLGAPHVRFVAPRYRGGSVTRLRQRTVRGLARLVELAEPHGLRVLLETSPDTLAPSPELALGLLESLPPRSVGVQYDPGNMVIEGHLAPALAIASLRPSLRHVHVKNIAWSRRAGVWRWTYAPLSGGLLDWPVIMSLLAAAGYRGRFSIDHLGGRPTLALLRAETNYLRALVDRAG
jgi:sugar phosphate isomerase/epimerase